MNKIATKSDCNGKAPGAFPATDDLTTCPTKAEIKATGVLDVTGNYADNQCVMLSDIKADFKLTISPTSYTAVIGGGSFTLNITSNTSWSVSYPSWCSGVTSGNGNASITVTVASNANSPARSGNITVRTASGITKSCSVNQSGVPTYGGRIHLMVQFKNVTPFTVNVSGNVALYMGSTKIGEVSTSGVIPGNTQNGQTVGASGMNGFTYSSTNKSVRCVFEYEDWSGDDCSGTADGSVSGNATGPDFLGVMWAGDPVGESYECRLSFIQSGSSDTYITAIYTISGRGV
ncbi:BACON domain-containing protein [uncultured Rikenella sp.]|uniref:BACON domain-containing protein n=1 Tax=uncultured Rikenella sp. TaxID=368003 RepID=UPI00272D87BC|nr:BACON domain-containing protein [uncultured Rikenella sp.]